MPLAILVLAILLFLIYWSSVSGNNNSASSRRAAKFEWPDVWLLESIACASREEPAELWNVISYGDAINHAILNYEEIEAGLPRLMAVGYVVHEKERLSLSPEFLPTYNQLVKYMRIGGNPELKEYMLSQSVDEAVTSAEPIACPIRRADYEEAVLKYLEWAKTHYR